MQGIIEVGCVQSSIPQVVQPSIAQADHIGWFQDLALAIRSTAGRRRDRNTGIDQYFSTEP
jgi:hypothetical protein